MKKTTCKNLCDHTLWGWIVMYFLMSTNIIQNLWWGNGIRMRDVILILALILGSLACCFIKKRKKRGATLC